MAFIIRKEETQQELIKPQVLSPKKNRMTHSQLVDYSWKWLYKSSYAIAAWKELTTATNVGEIPDVFGIKSGENIHDRVQSISI